LTDGPQRFITALSRTFDALRHLFHRLSRPFSRPPQTFGKHPHRMDAVARENGGLEFDYVGRQGGIDRPPLDYAPSPSDVLNPAGAH
jgi:hypothetical protein